MSSNANENIKIDPSNDSVKNDVNTDTKVSVNTDTKISVNKDTKTSEFTLLSFEDKVILRVFSFLDWIDAIHLARTCKRLNKIKFWVGMEHEEFDLSNYLKKGSIPITNVMNSYGSHIRVLSAGFNEVNQTVMEKCLNVTSLKISPDDLEYGDEDFPWNAFAVFCKWTKQLQLESFRMQCETDNVLELYEGLQNVKELMVGLVWDEDIYTVLQQNEQVERLYLNVNGYFTLRGLIPLNHLKCLHINQIPPSELPRHFKEILDFTALTEFSIREFNYSDCELSEFNSFLNGLATKTKLERLSFYYNGFINRNTFNELKLFDLTALSLHARFSETELRKFILECPASHLKYFRFGDFHDDILYLVKIMVENWKNLRSICCLFREGRENLELDDLSINNILKLSSNRPPLTLEIHHAKDYTTFRHVTMRIKFCFNTQKVIRTIVKKEDEPESTCTCVMTKVFAFGLVSGFHSLDRNRKYLSELNKSQYMANFSNFI